MEVACLKKAKIIHPYTTNTYLNGDNFDVSNIAGQLNHRLHSRDGPFDALVNEISPEHQTD